MSTATTELKPITLNLLRINLPTETMATAEKMLTRPGVAGLLVVEIQDILSPHNGRKNITNYGPGVPNRATLDEAIATATATSKMKPVAYVDRESIHEEIATRACKKIQDLAENQLSRATDILKEVAAILADADREIARFKA